MIRINQHDLYLAAKAFIWFIAGITMVTYLGGRGFSVYQAMQGGGRSPAHVIDTFEREWEWMDGRRMEIVHTAVYEFLVGGKRFRGETERDYELGDELMIEFNPRNPNQNIAVGDERKLLVNYFVYLLFGGMGAYLAIRFSYDNVIEYRRATK